MSSRSRNSNRLSIVIYTEGLPITGEDPVDCSLGGAETAVVSMARALARRGHHVTVYANTPAPRKVEGVQYRRSSDLAGNFDAASCDIFLSCRAHDVVDRIPRSCAIGLWCHDPPDTGTIGLTEKGLRKASFAFFLSEFHRNEFAKHIPSLAPFARVTSNGVDHDAIDMVLRGRNLVSGRPKFIYGARPVRGLEFLLTEIWPQVVTDLPGAELLVSGYDFGALCEGDAGRLECNREWNNFFGELIRNQPGVRSLGSLHRRRFWEEMAKCTAVLYPTETPEVNCMIALEAQALGVPMVTTDDFALRETLGFKPTRVQAPWGTPNYVTEFVAATVRLVKDPEFAEEARKAGPRHVSRETHSWDAIAEAWEALFHDEVTRRLAFHSSPKVSALVLVRRGQEMLERCLTSVSEIADEVIVGDARPTQMREQEALRLPEHGAFPGCRMIPIDFIDCAQARNELASHAIGEFLLSLDAAEVLMTPELLREAIDDNVFFDAFRIECSVKNPGMQLPPAIRCFRHETPEGPLKWFGCCYESVGHAPNQPPLRCRPLDGVSIRLDDADAPLFRGCLDDDEVIQLMIRDRRENSGRTQGYLMGMLHYLALARHEQFANQGTTSIALRCLNDCFEIWMCQGDAWSGIDRETGFQLSRRALALLAEFDGRLRLTRRSPVEASYSVRLKRGSGSRPTRVSGSLFFADAEELQQYLNEIIAGACPEMEEQSQFAPALITEAGTIQGARRPLPVEWFGLARSGGLPAVPGGEAENTSGRPCAEGKTG